MELYILIGLVVVVLVLQVVLLLKKPKNNTANTNYESNFQHIESYIADEFSRSRKETSESLNNRLSEMNALIRDIQQINTQQSEKVGETLTKNINSLLESNEKKLDQMREVSAQQNERINETLTKNLTALQENNEKKLEQMREISAQQNERINETLTRNLTALQENNEKKLEQMRMTVDEKLTDTLSKRLDSSFKVVGEQLKSVYESLGEMRKITGDVTALQRVLTNVKARGTWAEVQLGNILEQTLTKDQYDCNVSTKNDTKRVEFAVKIPSREKDGETVWLPIDSKFPQEDYIRICEAAEKADKEALEAAQKALEQNIKNQAKTIAELYINVPKTTDFAIMFLATEGLYSEVLRRPGLCEEIQNKYRIMICGPTTITAFLNTLNVGFRTIALNKKTTEIQKTLSAVSSQYDLFESLLAKAKKKIDEAGSSIEAAQKRNTTIQRKLHNVDKMDADEAEALLNSGE